MFLSTGSDFLPSFVARAEGNHIALDGPVRQQIQLRWAAYKI